MNIAILLGRLTADPETRYTATGTAVCSFTIAVDRDRKDSAGNRQTDFLRCKAFNKTAEFVQNYFAKGRMIGVEGSIQIDRVEKDGQKREYISIAVNKAFFTGEKRDDSSRFEPTSQATSQADYDDSDVPF